MRAVELDVLLRDGDRVGPMRAIFTPGHTEGHFAFFDEVERVRFAGDALAFVDGRLRYMARNVTPDLSAARASMKKCLELPVEWVCRGGGGLRAASTRRTCATSPLASSETSGPCWAEGRRSLRARRLGPRPEDREREVAERRQRGRTLHVHCPSRRSQRRSRARRLRCQGRERVQRAMALGNHVTTRAVPVAGITSPSHFTSCAATAGAASQKPIMASAHDSSAPIIPTRTNGTASMCAHSR